jgi:hypothetical protein
MLPVKPVWHCSVCCWLLIWHVGGFSVQVSWILNQSVWTG